MLQASVLNEIKTYPGYPSTNRSCSYTWQTQTEVTVSPKTAKSISFLVCKSSSGPILVSWSFNPYTTCTQCFHDEDKLFVNIINGGKDEFCFRFVPKNLETCHTLLHVFAIWFSLSKFWINHWLKNKIWKTKLKKPSKCS